MTYSAPNHLLTEAQRVATIAALDEYLEAVHHVERDSWRRLRIQRLRTAVARVFRRQRVELLKALATRKTAFSEALSQAEADGLWDGVQRDTHDVFMQAVRDHLTPAYLQGTVQQQMDALGLSAADLAKATATRTFTAQDPRLLRYLETHGAELVSGVNETTRAGLRAILVQGAEEGWGYPRVAREIRRTFDGFTAPAGEAHLQDRAERIALTEVGNAEAAGNLASARAMADDGHDMEKSWDAAGAKPCPACTSNVGAGWIPLDDSFPSGHDAPTAHPSCTCSLRSRLVRTSRK